MRSITQWFTILAPLLILVTDFIVYRLWGYDATITAVVRDWHRQCWGPEVIYVLGAAVLYLHLFRNWL